MCQRWIRFTIIILIIVYLKISIINLHVFEICKKHECFWNDHFHTTILFLRQNDRLRLSPIDSNHLWSFIFWLFWNLNLKYVWSSKYRLKKFICLSKLKIHLKNEFPFIFVIEIDYDFSAWLNLKQLLRIKLKILFWFSNSTLNAPEKHNYS